MNIIRLIKKHIVSILSVLIIVLLFSFWFGSTINEALRLTQLKYQLKAEIQDKNEINEQLNDEIAQIGTQTYIEKIARNYLGLYYPNEQIIIPTENKLKNNKDSVDVNVQIPDSTPIKGEEETQTDETQTE